jgi:hypothetical protein
LLHPEIARLRPLEDPVSVDGGALRQVDRIGAHDPAVGRALTTDVNTADLDERSPDAV